MTDEVTQTNQETYDIIATQYAEVRGETTWDSELLGQLVVELSSKSVILDLGCGPGVESDYFKDSNFFVVPIDLSIELLRIARGRSGQDVVQADGLHLPLRSESVNGIWSSAVLLHVPHEDTSKAIEEMARVLKPYGRLALITAADMESEAADGAQSGVELEPVPYAQDEARWYFYRRPADLIAKLKAANFEVRVSNISRESRVWVEIFAVKRPT